ncbi:serine hydrolase [Streptomyces sp. NPDC058655]|uniref:D-alanyl-D-alanine carboxypeptidase n=1 Tax=Streptomyces sp. NPDC058655 TaxID=3346577 RepID=UPI0036696EBC
MKAVSVAGSSDDPKIGTTGERARSAAEPDGAVRSADGGPGPSPTAETGTTAEAAEPDGPEAAEPADREPEEDRAPNAAAETEAKPAPQSAGADESAGVAGTAGTDREDGADAAPSPAAPSGIGQAEDAGGEADSSTASEPEDAEDESPEAGTPPTAADEDDATPAPARPLVADRAEQPAADPATAGPPDADRTAAPGHPEAPEATEPAHDDDNDPAPEAGTPPTAADEDVAAPEPAPGSSPRTAPRRPSWARGSESDAERTSRFVALEPLDGPAPAAAPTPPTAVGDAPREAVAAPLELLAELTNTAPPPETPRRTALRRVKVWTPILLLLAGAVCGAQLLRPLPAPKLVGSAPLHTLDGQLTIPWPAKGQGAVRVSGSGDIGTFGEQKPVPTASVAKVMTAYVVLKDRPLRKADPGPDITVDAKTVADGTSTSESRIEGLSAGTKFSQLDMLKMLMIPSGNNVARLLARWDTGTDSEAAFVDKMNAAAKELGMNDTTYTDPSGLEASTVSTAADQLKLAEAIMKDEAFRSVVALPDAQIKGLPTPIYNNNGSLLTAGLSIRGIKTGSSTAAGGALMWAAYKSVGDETPLILGTLMDQHVESGPDPDGANSLLLVKANSKKIIEAVRAALASVPAVRKGDPVGYVDDGLGGRTRLVAARDLNVIGVPGQQLRLSLTAAAETVPHAAKAGSEVGVLTVGDGAGAKSVPVAVQRDLAEPSFGSRITRLG